MLHYLVVDTAELLIAWEFNQREENGMLNREAHTKVFNKFVDQFSLSMVIDPFICTQSGYNLHAACRKSEKKCAYKKSMCL